MGAWRYQLEQPFQRASEHLKGIEFANKWVTIIDGVATVSADYAWDGCSPKYYLPVLGWVGIPDGPDAADGKPEAYWASLLHDVLCQFRADIAIDKSDAVAILKELLLIGGFPHWRATLYAAAVNLFGPQDWKGRAVLPAAV